MRFRGYGVTKLKINIARNFLRIMVAAQILFFASGAAKAYANPTVETITTTLSAVRYDVIYSYSTGAYGKAVVLSHSGGNYSYYTYQPMLMLDGSEARKAMYAMLLSAISTGQEIEITFDKTCTTYYVTSCFRSINKVSI